MAKTLNIGSVISPVNLGITNGSIADKNGSFGAEKQILCSDGEKIEWRDPPGTDYIIKIGGTDWTTNITASASTTYDLGSITIGPGTWIIQGRASFQPTDSGNHNCGICLSTTSKNSTILDRKFGTSTQQLACTFLSVYHVTDTTTYYLCGTSNVAGTWKRTFSSNQFLKAFKLF